MIARSRLHSARNWARRGLAALGVVLAEQAAATGLEIRELAWLARDADPVAALTTAPAECLERANTPERMRSMRLGRVAFRASALLGGLAGRVGLSCNACHRNGHDHPAFHLVGVSGEPGTVDVTGAVFSTTRDDQVFNPVPIPSLLDVGSRPVFGSVRPLPDLPAFLHEVIVGEFEGEGPPQAVAVGLLDYVSALRREACPAVPGAVWDFHAAAADLRESMRAVRDAFERQDAATLRFATRATRENLGRIHRRYVGFESERAAMIAWSRSLGEVAGRTRKSPLDASIEAALVDLDDQLEALIGRLAERAAASLYDPEMLRRALEAEAREGRESSNVLGRTFPPRGRAMSAGAPSGP